MDITRIVWVGYGYYPNLTRKKKKKDQIPDYVQNETSNDRKS